MTPSVVRGLALTRKATEAVELLRQYRSGGVGVSEHDYAAVFAEVEEYDELVRRHAGLTLADAEVFEIGYGARPYRQVVLQSMGVAARGIDAERPLLGLDPAALADIVRRNGVERAAKSVVRRLLFDRADARALERGLRARGLSRRMEAARLLVGDAGDVEIVDGSLDLVISEDVFEHIRPDTLRTLVPRMARWLRPGGLALVRPNVFPGILGGHLLEWSRASMRANPPPHRRSDPWEHLRRRRFAPNTQLNELSRGDYRALFAPHFEILEERVAQPDLGREHLDERARAELAGWPEEELFSNQTLFVLRPAADQPRGSLE